jgi:hypothetical protein
MNHLLLGKHTRRLHKKYDFEKSAVYQRAQITEVQIKVLTNTNVPTVLAGRQMASLKLQEGHTPRAIRNKVLERIFGEGWGKLHHEDNRTFLPPPHLILRRLVIGVG